MSDFKPVSREFLLGYPLPSFAKLVFRGKRQGTRAVVRGPEFQFVHDTSAWHPVRASQYMATMPPLTVVSFSGCFVNSRGDVLTPDGVRLWGRDLSLGAESRHQHEPEYAGRLSGAYAYGLHPNPSFGHWLLHRLPRLFESRENSEGAGALVSGSKFDSTGLLGAIGVATEAVTALPASEPQHFYEVEKLVVSNHAAIPGRRRRVDWSRFERMVGRIVAQVADQSVPSQCAKVYLTRAQSPSQRSGCLNREMVEDFMRERGYFVVAPETLSFENQVQLMSHAEHVVSEHGSGGLLSVFSKTLKSVTYLSPRPNYEVLGGEARGAPWARSTTVARNSTFRFASVFGSGTFESWNADEDSIRRVASCL